MEALSLPATDKDPMHPGSLYNVNETTLAWQMPGMGSHGLMLRAPSSRMQAASSTAWPGMLASAGQRHHQQQRQGSELYGAVALAGHQYARQLAWPTQTATARSIPLHATQQLFCAIVLFACGLGRTSPALRTLRARLHVPSHRRPCA